MKKKELLQPSLTVKDVLERYPQAIQVFMQIGPLCIGCPADAFHTLEDVAYVYRLDLDQLLERMSKAIQNT